MPRPTLYYAITAIEKGIRESKYAPYRVTAWDWFILEGPYDHFTEAKTRAEREIWKRYSGQQATLATRNLKLVTQSRLAAYHISRIPPEGGDAITESEDTTTEG